MLKTTRLSAKKLALGHKRRGVSADDVYAEIIILDGFFAVSLLAMAVRNFTISLGHAEPVAGVAEIIERDLSVVAAYRVFAELAVNASQGDIDAAK